MKIVETIQTEIGRSDRCWFIKTLVTLAGKPYQLHLITHCAPEGELVSSVRTDSSREQGHLVRYLAFVIRQTYPRITEHTVRAQHEMLMSQLQRIKLDVELHYAR